VLQEEELEITLIPGIQLMTKQNFIKEKILNPNHQLEENLSNQEML
jgi:hypothetical protein